jgi:hypothetical protein
MEWRSVVGDKADCKAMAEVTAVLNPTDTESRLCG